MGSLVKTSPNVITNKDKIVVLAETTVGRENHPYSQVSTNFLFDRPVIKGKLIGRNVKSRSQILSAILVFYLIIYP